MSKCFLDNDLKLKNRSSVKRLNKTTRSKSIAFHKTQGSGIKPFLGSLKTSKIPSPFDSPSPVRKETRISSQKGIEAFSRQTSQRIIHSVYNLVTTKMPMKICENNELSKKNKKEIQTYFSSQKSIFKKTLESLVKKNAAQKTIPDHSSTLKVLENKYLDEINRIKEKLKAVKNELIQSKNERILKEKGKKKKIKQIETKKKNNEEKKIRGYEKEIIIKNIENFYKDKTDLIKEYYEKEQDLLKVKKYEEKVLNSEFVKEVKKHNLKIFLGIKSKLENRIEVLKEKIKDLNNLI